VPSYLPGNTYVADPALRSLLHSNLSPPVLAWAEPQLTEMGHAAAAELQRWGEECERHPAQLRPIDPWGVRVDEVIYPEAWKRIGAVARRAGLISLPYEADGRRRAAAQTRIVQAALGYLFQPSTATYFCPVAMTDGAARVLTAFGPEALRAAIVPRLLSRDPEQGWTAGQWMTERQGGSDVGSNAVAARRERDGWKLYGQKFFCSNVDAEVVLALARPEGARAGTEGLGLFLIPRHQPDGSRNRFRIDRLKDKLGTRAMATGEVTLEGAHAEVVGELDRGFQQMTPMLNITRLHNAVASAASMRRAVMLARGYAAHRSAFGRRLDSQPLHRQVLLEMAVQAEAGLHLTFRVAELLGNVETATSQPARAGRPGGRGLNAEELPGRPHQPPAAGASLEERLFRLGASLAKLYTARQAVAVASEAIECFGGPGYIEDTGIPRLLRDAQVLPIWEGTTSVLALDALRLFQKPEVVEAYATELARLNAPDRDQILSHLGDVARQDFDQVQRLARKVAFLAAETWIEGLLVTAAARGKREAQVADIWAARDQRLTARWPDHEALELVVDGSASPVPVG